MTDGQSIGSTSIEKKPKIFLLIVDSLLFEKEREREREDEAFLVITLHGNDYSIVLAGCSSSTVIKMELM